MVGLYLNPPDKAVVVCIDEKSQIQALDRTAPILPIRPGLPEKATHDYVRHGTTTLFAALQVATGKVTDACYPRHTHAEFLAFLKQVAKAYPRVPLHVVADNYATHVCPESGGGGCGASSRFRPRDPRRSCPHRSVLAATPLRLPEVTIRTSASVLMPCQQPGRRPGRHRILKRLATA